MLFHKEMLAEGEIRSHYRQCLGSRSIDYKFEWYSKFIWGSFSRRKITYEGMLVRRGLNDGKRRIDGQILQSSLNNSCQEEKEQEVRTFP